VYSSVTNSTGANLRLLFCIQSLAAPMRELLVAVLHSKIRSERWRQVLASLFSNGFSRSNTLRDLREYSRKFRALASYLNQAHIQVSNHNSIGVHGAIDDLRARMVGRSELLEKMVSMVLSAAADGGGTSAADAGGRLLVMPIVGGPGIGKTRLAMALLSDYRVRRNFRVRHRLYSLGRVLMRMTSHMDIGIGDRDTGGVPMAVVGRRLSIGGNYLIVLDDVWGDTEGNCPQVRALMKALPWNGSLVVTTRSPGVASYLATVAEASGNTSKPLYLRPLEHGFSSTLAAQWTVAYRGDWPTELAREAGRAIADKCGGVPILLEHARTRFCQPQGLLFWQGFLEHAQSISNKNNTSSRVDHYPGYIYLWRELLGCIDGLPHDEFWKRFLGHSGELPDAEGNAVLESAAISYQHLPSDMRSCLLYCSIFPSGHDFDVEELTDLLAAEGYIPPVVTKAQRKGFLQQLLDECFYPLQGHEYGDKCTYRMHKVLHIFAQYIDRDTSAVIRVDQAATAQSLASVRRASLIVNPSASSFPTSLFQCHDLEALILRQQGEGLADQPRCEIAEIPQHFFHWRIQALSLIGTKIRLLPTKFLDPSHVKYLNLSQTPIENIPSSISRLMFLQTLVLSYCVRLKKLHPNTTKLTLLQKLDLEGCCNLVELPRDIGNKMKTLEYLNVSKCPLLTRLPRGMGQLKVLQMLLGYIVSNTDGSSMAELHPLVNLHRLSLQNLEKVSDPLDASFASLSFKTNLESLSLRWNMDDYYSIDTTPAYEVIKCLEPHRHLKALEIIGYEGDKLPSWITGPHLRSLVEIKLINLRSCEWPPLALLPCLKIAEISGVETISGVNDSFYGRKGIFPSLQKLTFSYMQNLEVWEQAQRADMFPRLIELEFIQCPKLRALHMELPSLEKLILWMNNKVLYDQKGALQGVAKTLEHVSISFSEELASSDCEGLQDLGKLTNLEICGCDELTCLPQCLQRLLSIRCLTIDNCRKLEVLPDWLENLPSLQIIRLSGCPLLHYIPRGLQQRPGVIIYVEDCPNLIQDHLPNFSAQSSGTSTFSYYYIGT
jgi:Leucine-rich repeat (LRR) protein